MRISRVLGVLGGERQPDARRLRGCRWKRDVVVVVRLQHRHRSAAAAVDGPGPVRWLLRRRTAGSLRRGKPDAVEMLPGGGDVVPQQVGSASDGSEFTIARVPKVLEARESGSTLCRSHRSSSARRRSSAWADSGITRGRPRAGTKIGRLAVWQRAGGARLGPDPRRTWRMARLHPCRAGLRYERVINAQDGCRRGATDRVDVAEAMVYNEWAGCWRRPTRTRASCSSRSSSPSSTTTTWAPPCCRTPYGHGESWLAEDGNEDVATRFPCASFKGWICCRDHPDDCVRHSSTAAASGAKATCAG